MSGKTPKPVEDSAPAPPAAEKLTPLQRVEAQREARKADVRRKLEAQLAIDLEAISELEVAHGDSNVGVIRLPFTEGLPAAVACRCPRPAEVKRFRDQIKPHKDGRNRDVEPDTTAPAEMLASVCRIYPDAETYEALCVARPGIAGQLAGEAMKLATGKEEADLKG